MSQPQAQTTNGQSGQTLPPSRELSTDVVYVCVIKEAGGTLCSFDKQTPGIRGFGFTSANPAICGIWFHLCKSANFADLDPVKAGACESRNLRDMDPVKAADDFPREGTSCGKPLNPVNKLPKWPNVKSLKRVTGQRQPTLKPVIPTDHR